PTGSYEDMFYCDKQKEICLIMSGGQGLNFRVKMIYGKDESRKTNGFVLKLILCCNLGINPDQIFEIASINYIFHKTQGVWRSIKIEEISDGVEGLDLFGERFWSASGNDTFGVVQDKIRSWIVITLGSELQCSIRPA
ncbi:MAG: hypothetical protein RLY43_1036, partial [Bacteroidota bacterium]